MHRVWIGLVLEQKKSLDKTVLIIWSQICGKMTLIVLEKYNFLNLILRGYILAITHFVTQFTHVSRHPRV